MGHFILLICKLLRAEIDVRPYLWKGLNMDNENNVR